MGEKEKGKEKYIQKREREKRKVNIYKKMGEKEKRKEKYTQKREREKWKVNIYKKTGRKVKRKRKIYTKKGKGKKERKYMQKKSIPSHIHRQSKIVESAYKAQ